MLTAYLTEAMSRARYKVLEDGSYFGEVPGLPGVWSNEQTLETCRKILQEVLEEWLMLKLRDNERMPFASSLNTREGVGGNRRNRAVNHHGPQSVALPGRIVRLS